MKGWAWKTLVVLTLVGGAVHLLDALSIFNLLSIFGSWASWVQGIAGAATLWVGFKVFKKK